MRVLICPDKFAGTLSAVAAANAIAEGWRSAAPDDELILRPIADGGPGFVEVLHESCGGTLIDVPTTDPLGRPVTGQVLVLGDTSYVESAQACGLHHLTPAERNPRLTSSAGLRPLIAACPTRKIVIGLGGSSTNDGGAGWLTGDPDPARCQDSAFLDTWRDLDLVGASDVDNPLLGRDGATYVFGPQKGATPQDLEFLEQRMTDWARKLPSGVATAPGGGAAGGLGAAILALGGTLTSGIDLVSRLTGLDKEIARADVVITGEGSFDHQSLRGKAISGLAKFAGDKLVVLAGRVTVEGLTAYSLIDHFGSVEQALAEPERGLRELAGAVAKATLVSGSRPESGIGVQ